MGAEMKLLWIGSCSLGGGKVVSRIRCWKQSIDVDPFEIIKLVASWIENLPADHDTNEDALTVEYVAAHDQTSSPLGTPPTLSSLAENSERNRFPVGPRKTT